MLKTALSSATRKFSPWYGGSVSLCVGPGRGPRPPADCTPLFSQFYFISSPFPTQTLSLMESLLCCLDHDAPPGLASALPSDELIKVRPTGAPWRTAPFPGYGASLARPRPPSFKSSCCARTCSSCCGRPSRESPSSQVRARAWQARGGWPFLIGGRRRVWTKHVAARRCFSTKAYFCP